MRIEPGVLRELQRLAVDSHEGECCGVLWASSDTVVDRYGPHPGPLQPRSFRFDWDWWLKELYRGRARGWCFQGLYHSHPAGESLSPSSADLQGHPKGSRVLFLSPDARPARLFLLKGPGLVAEELELELAVPSEEEHFPL